jgi:antitoxin MazE
MEGRVVTRVQKWGNSLGLRIPKSFAAEAKVGEGSPVELSVENGALVVRPVQRRYSLDELLARVTRRNVHGEVDSGAPVGREVW